LNLTGVALQGAALLAGRPLSDHARVRAAEFLETPILRAEMFADRLSVVAARQPRPAGIARLQARFPKLQLKVHLPGVFDGLLAGLEDDSGQVLDLGILGQCDFTGLLLKLVTPLTDLRDVRLVRVGSIRIRKDGADLGTIRPGDI